MPEEKSITYASNCAGIGKPRTAAQPILVSLLALFFICLPTKGLEYPWGILVPENDSRDPEMRDHDVADSANMVAVINASEKPFHHHVVQEIVSIKNLLSARIPFCEMHFDGVRPLVLTPDEKAILQEYLKRGGFILFLIDTYPYTQDEFWPIKEWPLIDFLKQELPAADPHFTAGRATDDFPIFHLHYETETADAIRHELTGNPNTPNRTLIFYEGRLCCFVMGSYGYLKGGQWMAVRRPFPYKFSMDPKAYRMVVNIYNYSIVQ
jgi:hypothetical protein